jgi:hypothetical protein
MAVACTTLLQQLDRGDHFLAKSIHVSDQSCGSGFMNPDPDTDPGFS